MYSWLFYFDTEEVRDLNVVLHVFSTMPHHKGTVPDVTFSPFIPSIDGLNHKHSFSRPPISLHMRQTALSVKRAPLLLLWAEKHCLSKFVSLSVRDLWRMWRICRTCKPTKPNLPNQTYQTKTTKPNQAYLTKPNKLNLPNQAKPTKPNMQKQTYKTKLNLA